jgi:hypothetical protein
MQSTHSRAGVFITCVRRAGLRARSDRLLQLCEGGVEFSEGLLVFGAGPLRQWRALEPGEHLVQYNAVSWVLDQRCTSTLPMSPAATQSLQSDEMTVYVWWWWWKVCACDAKKNQQQQQRNEQPQISKRNQEQHVQESLLQTQQYAQLHARAYYVRHAIGGGATLELTETIEHIDAIRVDGGRLREVLTRQ